jgi:hypothetical protein
MTFDGKLESGDEQDKAKRMSGLNPVYPVREGS